MSDVLPIPPRAVIGPRRSPLVGRARELGVLRSAAVAARDGHGGLVLVHGEAGVGKSRLCRELATSLSATLQLRGQAYPGDDGVAHAILLDTLRGARRTGGSALWPAAKRRASVLGGAVPELLDEGIAPAQFEDETQVFEATLDAVEEAAAGALVVWMVEDVHWADEASWRLLHYCSRRAPSMRLLLLVTFRDDEQLPDAPGWTRLVVPGSREGVTRVELRRLSAADTARLVRDVSAAALAEGEVLRIADRSGGTPLLVEELVAMRQMDATGERVPDVVRATARERLRRAGDGAACLLELAAVLGHDADLDLLVDLRPDQTGGIDALVEAGLLRAAGDAGGSTVEFRHPLLLEAVYADIPWERRRRLHAEAAGALTGDTSMHPVERVARHWELAGQPAQALDALLGVIEVARAHGNIRRAATLELQALSLIERCPALRPRRAALVAPAVGDLFTVSQWAELAPLAREAWETARPGTAERLRLSAILAQAEWNTGAALPLIRERIDAELEALPRGEAGEELAVLEDASGLVTFSSGDLATARRRLVRSIEHSRTCGSLDGELRARVHLLWVDLCELRDRAEVGAEFRALAAAAWDAGLRPRHSNLVFQIARLTLDEADIAAAEAAGRESAPWFELGGRVLRAQVATFAGRTEGGAMIEEISRSMPVESVAGSTLIIAAAELALMRGELDRVAELRATIEASNWMSSGNLAPDIAMVRGWHAWELGDMGAAAEAFALTVSGVRTSRLEPGMSGPFFVPLHVDALLRCGRSGDAARLLEELAGEDMPSADPLTRAGFTAARARLDPAPGALAAAAAQCRASRWAWLEGLVLLWTAELVGNAAAAVGAREVWRRCGYHPGVERAARLLARGGKNGARPLTSREETIADLVAEGLTNAQIAERLAISAVTVAHHVSSVLDKLGVGSRTQVAVLRAQGRGR